MRKTSLLLLSLTLLVVGCAGAPAADDADADELTLDDCVSEQGQRLLTFCASADAATLAERQHNLHRAADDSADAQNMVALPVDAAPVRGERDAPVTVHLFSDLNCADCRSAYERLSAEVEHRAGKLRLVFRHVPVDDAGERLARAAIAADEQGKFWEFVDELYAYDRIPDADRWADVADDAGLDVDTWEQDRRMPTVDAVLEHDAIKAEEADIVEAPTYFVNGIRNVGSIALQEFDEVAEEELRHVEAMEDAGLTGADISWRRILQNYQPVDWDDVEQAEQQLQRELPVIHIPVENSPHKGADPDEAKATAVLFADFTCPYSADAARQWDRLVELFGDRGLRVVFKHFPLGTDEDADLAAAAAVIAQQGGVFWPFHDALFFDGIPADADHLEQTLRDLGWDGPDFNALVNDDAIRGIVARDRQLGADSAVEGTPTVFINGIMLEGVWPAEELAPLVEDQIALARSISELTENQGEELYRDVVEANRE